MNRIDVRTEVRKITNSKPVYAAAGVGVVASQALRQLPARLAKLRREGVSSLPARATGYVLSARAKAADEYERLASRGRKALDGHATTAAKDALRGKPARSGKSK